LEYSLRRTDNTRGFAVFIVYSSKAVEKTTMKTAMTLMLVAITCLTACTTTARQNAGSPPPFECTSIHPEVCELEEQFHQLRHEQAKQNAAIDEAERKRKAQMKTAGTVVANAAPAS
jgi:hypothetical protein